MEVAINKIYRHYKGDLYIVIAIGYNSENLDKMVVYRALYGNNVVWCRPYANFTEEINQNGQKHRFELQNIPSLNNDHSDEELESV